MVILLLAWLMTAIGLMMVVLYLSSSVQLMNRYTMMAASFIPYGIIAWLAAVVLFLIGARGWGKTLALLAVAGLVLQLVWAQGYFPLRKVSVSPSADATTLFTLNVRCDSSSRDATAETVLELSPDIVVMQDSGQRMREEFEEQGADLVYPYREFFSRESLPSCGIEIYSKKPIERVDIGVREQAAVTAEIGSTKVLLLATDIATPTKNLEGWEKEIAGLGEVAAAADLPVLVVGDFNAVAEHFPVRRILKEANLHEVTSGLGWFPTFDAARKPGALIQIDHVLASPTITAANAEAMTIGRNAHRALMVWLENQ